MKTKISLCLLVLLTLACTLSASPESGSARFDLPTAAPTSKNPVELAKNELKIQRGGELRTLGQLNARMCPATNCDVLGTFEAGDLLLARASVVDGVVIPAGVKIETPNVLDCPRWYSVVYKGVPAFVCAEWVSR